MQLTDDQSLAAVAARHGRMVEAAIISGEPEKAHAAVVRAFAELAMTNAVTPESRLTELLTLRMSGLLEAGGIETIGQLCEHTRDSLAEIHQIRYRSIDIIEQALARCGMSLRLPEKK